MQDLKPINNRYLAAYGVTKGTPKELRRAFARGRNIAQALAHKIRCEQLAREADENREALARMRG